MKMAPVNNDKNAHKLRDGAKRIKFKIVISPEVVNVFISGSENNDVTANLVVKLQVRSFFSFCVVHKIHLNTNVCSTSKPFGGAALDSLGCPNCALHFRELGSKCEVENFINRNTNFLYEF